MKIKNLLLLITTLFLTLLLSAQSEHANKTSLGLTTAYTYAKSHFIQIGAIWGSNYGNAHIPSKGYGLGVDIGNVNNDFTVGAKVFYEYNFFIITGSRLNLINYFSGQNSDLRLMPQFGFSLLGNVNFLYGYSIPFLGNELKDISRHSFSITINLFREEVGKTPSNI